MPSWIKERDGLEWYDEAYTTKQTNQGPDQLASKVAAGKLRSFKDKSGRWYARPDVEALRAAWLKRKDAAKKRAPTTAQLEARYRRQSEELRKTSRQLHGGPLLAHANKVTIAEIFANPNNLNPGSKKED